MRALLLPALLSLSLPALAGAPAELRLKGEVDDRMAAQVRAFLRAGGKTIVVTSEGGDAAAGIAIGSLLARSKASVEVDGYCISACANYLFLGAPAKALRPGAVLGFHGGITSADRALAPGGKPNAFERQEAAIKRRQRAYLALAGLDDAPVVESAARMRSGQVVYTFTFSGPVSGTKQFPHTAYDAMIGEIARLKVDHPDLKYTWRMQDTGLANGLYFPSLATLRRWGVRGVGAYPYPADQAALDAAVKEINADLVAAGDFAPAE